MAWLQLIFDVKAEKAEALSDALTECGAAAITYEDNADQPIYEPAVGTTPLWSSTKLIALFDAETDLDIINNMLSHLLNELPEYRVEAVEDKDWEREWMDNFHPIQFGKQLWICPSWHEPPDANAINIMLDPGLAFGTGTHETTALCLKWLADSDLSGKTVIDYGCGSGILGIAAALLGAKKVIGVDIDPQALQATQANAVRNNVQIETYLPEQCPVITCDLMIANILAGPLQQLAPTLTQLSGAETQIVLSGVLHSQAQTVLDCYQSEFAMDAVVAEADWVRLTGRRHHG